MLANSSLLASGRMKFAIGAWHADETEEKPFSTLRIWPTQRFFRRAIRGKSVASTREMTPPPTFSYTPSTFPRKNPISNPVSANTTNSNNAIPPYRMMDLRSASCLRKSHIGIYELQFKMYNLETLNCKSLQFTLPFTHHRSCNSIASYVRC